MLKMKDSNKNLIISLAMSTLGTVFLIYYIFRASVDVVASDYIRIINYYLEDVTDLHYLLSWEGISRIPFTFLARFINVKFFNYSVFFDKILGTFGLFLFNIVVLSFALDNIKSKIMQIISSILITYISFSLMAWEMILNGTGYAHFITVGLIALTFRIFSNRWAKLLEQDENESTTCYSKLNKTIILCVLILFTSILFAGSYAVSYNSTIIFSTILLLIYGINSGKIKERYTIIETVDKPFSKEDFAQSKFHGYGKYKIFGVKRKSIVKWYPQVLFMIIPVICLYLYFKSNSTGEALIPVGFKDITIFELLKTEPLFPIKFLLKSLASSIIGVETFDYAINFKTITEKIIFFVGFLYLIVIIYAIIILIYKVIKITHKAHDNVVGEKDYEAIGARCYEINDLSFLMFVCMFFVYGIANYLLIFLARYKFVVDSYGMTSRYSLQYMFLTIGIVMLFAKLLDDYVCNGHTSQSDDASAKHSELSIVIDNNKRIKKIFLIATTILSLFFITLGHLTTNTDEIFKADYRKIIYSIIEDKAKNYKNLTDEDLENSFEFHRGPDQIRKAFNTLETKHLNIFRDKK